jgi:hypothetical protein
MQGRTSVASNGSPAARRAIKNRANQPVTPVLKCGSAPLVCAFMLRYLHRALDGEVAGSPVFAPTGFYILCRGARSLSLRKPHKLHSGKPGKVDLKCSLRSPSGNMVEGAFSIVARGDLALRYTSQAAPFAWRSRTQNPRRRGAKSCCG